MMRRPMSRNGMRVFVGRSKKSGHFGATGGSTTTVDSGCLTVTPVTDDVVPGKWTDSPRMLVR
jgi:hypothetical protein